MDGDELLGVQYETREETNNVRAGRALTTFGCAQRQALYNSRQPGQQHPSSGRTLGTPIPFVKPQPLHPSLAPSPLSLAVMDSSTPPQYFIIRLAGKWRDTNNTQ